MKHITWKRAALSLAASAVAVGLATPAVAAGAPASQPAQVTTDPAGDVYNDDDDYVNVPAADFLSADARKSGSNLELRYRVNSNVSPESDPLWESEDSWIYFLLDTDGDQVEDVEVLYALDEEGELFAEVYESTENDDGELLCEGDASFANGGLIKFPLDCIDTPARIGYRVEIEYDLDVNDPDSQCAYDEAPETGFTQAGRLV